MYTFFRQVDFLQTGMLSSDRYTFFRQIDFFQAGILSSDKSDSFKDEDVYEFNEPYFVISLYISLVSQVPFLICTAYVFNESLFRSSAYFSNLARQVIYIYI